MNAWQRFSARATEASHITAAAITLAFAAPVALIIYLHQYEAANSSRELAKLRAESLAS